MAIITISRTTGSNGDEIGHLTASTHGMRLYTRELAMREWLPSIATQYELHMLDESPRFYLQKSKSGVVFADYLEMRLKEEVKDNPSVVLGMASQLIFSDRADAFNVRIVASDEVRISRLMSSYRLDIKESVRFLELSDRKHHRYINTIYGKDWADPTLYHMTLNTDRLSIQEASEMIAHSAGLHDIAATYAVSILPDTDISGISGPGRPDRVGMPEVSGMSGIPGKPGMHEVPGMHGMPAKPGMHGMHGMPAKPEMPVKPGISGMSGLQSASGIQDSGSAAFKHPSEQEFARILDMYNIQWIYEPKTFPVEWDAEGNIKMAFTPDFYLPRFDTYIELTTMEQKYVSEKKKKVRRINELYPDIKINIVFKDDYHSLLKRFQRG